MSTKYELSDKNLFQYDIDDKQHSNFNLNRNLQNSSSNAFPKSSKNISPEQRKPFNYNFSNKHSSKTDLWNKSTKNIYLEKIVGYQKNEDEWKKDKNAINGSTLSLHISTYKNFVEAKLVDCIKEENTKQIKKDKKQIFAVLQTKNPFEFPRQHENGQSKATEIGQFKASQRLLNHNQMDQMSDSIWSRPTFSTKGPETNNSTSYASFSSASSNGTTGSSSSFLNSELSPPEKVKAEAIDDAFKVATESINQTLKLSRTAEAHYNQLNLELAEKVSDQLSKIEIAKSILETRMTAIQCNMSEGLDPQIFQGLLNRYETVKGKLLLRQESLKKLLDSANEYFSQSYVEEISEMIEEAHNRLLFLQKEINGGSNELEDQLENIATLLQKFISLSFYGISASAAYETSEISLQKIEREAMLNDTLNHIRHVIECIKRAKEEPPTEATLPQTSQSESIESLSDF